MDQKIKSNKIYTKKNQIKKMFDRLSVNYDMMNTLFTLGIDKIWRKKLVNKLSIYKPKKILDIATGTADLAIEIVKIKPEKIIGIDISKKMISMGNTKIKKLKYERIIELREGDCEKIPFENNSFDAVTVSFGVRNFENLDKCLIEILRVLKKGGILLILETSIPKSRVIFFCYDFYLKTIYPLLYNLFSKNKNAYKYLRNSSLVFPNGKKFNNILMKNGFINVNNKPLTFGATSLYFGKKP